jgi:hypothetical protein
MSELSELLEKHNACSEAIEWAKNYETLSDAWAVCERGDWMLWIAGKEGLCTRQELVFAACQCARLSLPYTKDKRVLICIEITEAWTRGEATIDDVKIARKSASAAAYVAYVADAYSNAAYVAYAAASAASVDAYASSAAAATRKEVLKQCADLVRYLYK